ncbi:hypothetical protein MB901379_01461 [Mycobacterium basiliense]|uniref:Uncharacterized protein n=1 Tax=Mycobacterium basiliense TaxID=2094119 RepID=A0A447GBP6_9MYCO|nr:hypothetical protein [Mycobacterium basiliense]VDM87910.1 hypothetical protein MB901379_01461 [Mycobacterium basiliense]
MARDTKGPPPAATYSLRRVSLDPHHWHQVRWFLGAEAVAASSCGAAGLIAFYVAAPTRTQFPVAGLSVTPGLCWVLLGIAVTAAVAASRRRLALLFTAAASVCAVSLMFVDAIASTRSGPGPLGFDPAAIVLWGVLFCYNFGLGMWLIPDHLEGPDWVPTGQRSRDTSPEREHT